MNFNNEVMSRLSEISERLDRVESLKSSGNVQPPPGLIADGNENQDKDLSFRLQRMELLLFSAGFKHFHNIDKLL